MHHGTRGRRRYKALSIYIPAVTIDNVIDEPLGSRRSRRARRPRKTVTSTRVVKHEKQVSCPWCKAGSTMTFRDASGEYCMACKKDLTT
nr:hypothetical protein [Candidatus Sigynarchaeum springense]